MGNGKFKMHYTDKKFVYTWKHATMFLIVGMIIGFAYAVPYMSMQNKVIHFYYFPNDADIVFNGILNEFCKDQTGDFPDHVSYEPGYKSMTVNCIMSKNGWHSTSRYSEQSLRIWIKNKFNDKELV